MIKWLGERVDSFGLPLMESEIFVKFIHKGRPAEASFDVTGGKITPATHEEPKEVIEPEATFIGASFNDEDVFINEKELDLEDLKEKAIEKYWDLK